jgi:hypothetical protein
VHVPFEQNCPLGHGLPHAPQFRPSLSMSTHAPEQLVKVAVHWQLPSEHTAFDPQACPQPPQFCASDCVSAQLSVQ